MEVQIFGVRKSADTRAALRFFAERRIKTHFVDFAVRGPAAGELRRFVQRFGVERLLDREGRAFVARGLRAANYSDDRWLDLMVDEPGLLTVPLVRWNQRLTVGRDEIAWRGWIEQGQEGQR